MLDLAHKTDSRVSTCLNRHQQIAYALLDDQATIINVNNLMQQWFLSEGEDAGGRAISDILPQFLGWEEDFLATVKGSQECFTIPQLQMNLTDGSERYFDLIVERVTEAEGAFLVMLIDVTKQTRLQQMLLQQRNELQLSIDRLEQTAAERDQLIEDLDAFTQTVAHDLKSPTTSIIGFSDLLIDRTRELSPDISHHFLQLISKNGHKMSKMIDELLLLANVQRRQVELRPVNMVEAISGALERLLFLTEEHNAEIIAPRSWPTVIGYTPWVEEIWANYISNAIKYGGTPPRVEVGYRAVDADTIQFWVKDNGSGLSLVEREQLFSKFTRLGDKKIEGHGLGLSIVKRIATKLGGEVSVESQKGRGSTFCFSLPIALSDEVQADRVDGVLAMPAV